MTTEIKIRMKRVRKEVIATKLSDATMISHTNSYKIQITYYKPLEAFHGLNHRLLGFWVYQVKTQVGRNQYGDRLGMALSAY